MVDRSVGDVADGGLGLAFWQLDPADGRVTTGAGWAEVAGPGAVADLDALVMRIHPEDRPQFHDAIDNSAQSGLVMRVSGPDGGYRPVLCRIAPGAGGLDGIWALLPEDPARLRADRDAARAEAGFLRAALEGLPDGIFLLDAEGRFVIANDRLRALLPLMADTLEPGRLFADMLRIGLSRNAYPEAIGREEDWLAEALAFHDSPAPQVERTVRLAQGQWVLAIDRRLPTGGWVGLRVDITELKQSESRLAAILEGSGHATWEWDITKRAWISNPVIDRSVDGWLDSVGYSRRDIATTPLRLFRTICHPEDLARLDVDHDRHLAGEIDHIDVELRQRHRLGHWVWGRLRGKISTRDVDGTPLRMAGILADITDLKNVQLELERSARRKLDFLERISHEIRTPLNGVMGAVSLLSDTARDPGTAELMAVAEASGERLVAMIERLVELTRIEDGRLDLTAVPLRLDRLAAELRADHEAAATARGLTFEVLTDSTVAAPRLGDPRRLREAADNLVRWALDRSHGSVELRIRAGSGTEVRLELLDGGDGMDETTRAATFEPFFHEAGNARPDDGTSPFGLWQTARIVAAMGGHTRLDPARHGGMVVRIDLPLPHSDTG